MQNPYESPRAEPDPRPASGDSEDVGEQEFAAEDEIVPIASYKYVDEAYLARSLLEQEGIRCRLDDEGLVGNYALWSNAVGGVKIIVSQRDAARASDLLESLREIRNAKRSQEDITFACEECSAQLTFPGKRRGCVETCPKCGEYVDVPD